MRKYIDADRLEKDGWSMHRIRQASPTEMIYETKKPTDFPAADVVEVVRCKDCKYNDLAGKESANALCSRFYGSWQADDYCSCGERK